MSALRLVFTILAMFIPFVWLFELAYFWMVVTNVDCVPFSDDARECLSPSAQTLWGGGSLLLVTIYTATVIVVLRKLHKGAVE